MPAPRFDFRVDLHGWDGESARRILDQELNRAFMSERRAGLVICGHGKGVLRKVVREELAAHPLIEHFHGVEEGGAYVVFLAPRWPSGMETAL